MAVVVYVALALCFSQGLAGNVRRDPVTGKWMTVSNEQLKDARFHDSRAGLGKGDDLFGDFGFDMGAGGEENPFASKPTAARRATDPRQALQQQHNAAPRPAVQHAPAPVATQPVGVRSHDRQMKNKKYSADIPLSQFLAQTQGQAGLDLEQLSEDVPSLAPSQVQTVVHSADEVVSNVQVSANTLTPRVLGGVCRFDGIGPVSGCPAEASNGCVDRTPCQRACDAGGYFSWRCKGPQTFTPEEISQMAATEAEEPEEPHYEHGTGAHVDALTQRIKLALENSDYEGLARAILEAQSLHSASTSTASAQLLQTAVMASNQAKKMKRA